MIRPGPLQDNVEEGAGDEADQAAAVSQRIRLHQPGFEEKAVHWTWSQGNDAADFLRAVPGVLATDAAVVVVSFP